jgi:pimeloyl-ACP methyl ester carboxylesterase
VTDRHVRVVGAGPRVLLVHGSGHRDWTWADQLPLAERWRLVLPFRNGYGPRAPARPDFDVDAGEVAALLEDGAHLVGYSYGGVASLLAAARRPQAVHSLAVVEPPAFGLARGIPAVDSLVERLAPIYPAPVGMTAKEFRDRFAIAFGLEPNPRPFDDESRSITESMMRERAPTEAAIPLAELRAAPFPKLVASGGWNDAFDAVCERLTASLGAERAVFPGAGHGAQHAAGFNERLEAFWRTAG